MKRFVFILVMFLATVGTYAQEGKNIYNRYSGGKGVSAIYISPAMFKLIGKLPELNMEISDGESVDLAPLIRTFSGFYMLDINDVETAVSLKKEVDTMISKGRYELLMEV